MLANAIRAGFSGATVADIAVTHMPPDYISGVALQEPEQVIAEFRADAEAWKHLAPVEDKLLAFFDSFIARARELVKQMPAETRH